VRLKADGGQLNLAHGTKKYGKLKTKNRVATRNGPGDSPWRQSGGEKWNYGEDKIIRKLLYSLLPYGHFSFSFMLDDELNAVCVEAHRGDSRLYDVETTHVSTMCRPNGT